MKHNVNLGFSHLKTEASHHSSRLVWIERSIWNTMPIRFEGVKKIKIYTTPYSTYPFCLCLDLVNFSCCCSLLRCLFVFSGAFLLLLVLVVDDDVLCGVSRVSQFNNSNQTVFLSLGLFVIMHTKECTMCISFESSLVACVFVLLNASVRSLIPSIFL